MFLKHRVKRLEDRLDYLEQKERCAKGNHKWRLQDSLYGDMLPYIRCLECYATPPEKKQ